MADLNQKPDENDKEPSKMILYESRPTSKLVDSIKIFDQTFS